MSFTKKFETIIKKSDNTITKFNVDSGIVLESLSNQYDLLHSKKIIDGDYSFADFFFDITNTDSIYGIINNKKDSLIYIYIDDNIMTKTTLLKYDSNKNEIKFPFIKKLNKINHVLFYSIETKENNKTCNLIHYYQDKKRWVKTLVNTIDFAILSNFVVDVSENNLNLFYLKIVDGFEEVFLSTFDLENNIWIEPIQITDSHKSKVYLSVVRSTLKDYHIVFSENNSSRYFCTNINVSIENYQCTLSNYIYIKETIACTFPQLILYKKRLYAQWIEYHDLDTCCSEDLGKTWSKSKKDSFSFYPFSRYDYKSNSANDIDYNISTAFIQEDSFVFLGLPRDTL